MTYQELESTDDLSVSVPAKLNNNFLQVSELNTAAKTASFTAFADDATGSPKNLYFCNTTGGSITVTLPTAASGAASRGRVVTFVKMHASNNLILDGDGSETINGATTLTMTAIYDYRTIISDGTNWVVISNS